MAKKYIENIRLLAIRNKLFSLLEAEKEINIFDVLKMASGNYLPKSKMISGVHCVYGGGGLTDNTHIYKNIDYDTVGIGRVGARCGCVFKIEKNSWVTDNALFIKELKMDYELDFLIHFLNYKNLNQYANTAAQPVISLKRISNVTLPVVSKEKQQEIIGILNQVEKGEKKIKNDVWGVNNLLIQIGSSELLSSEQAYQLSLVKQLRQSFLREAMQGKLTKEWRELHPEPVEGATELLAKIKAEKEQLIKEKKIKKQKSFSSITEEEIPFEIPEKWLWCRLGEICETNGRIGWKGLTASEYKKSGPLFLSVHSLNYGDYVDYSQAFHITQERYDESPEIMLQDNDILICKDGAGIGKLGIIRNLEEQATINSSLLLIRKYKNINSKYIYYFLLSSHFQKIVNERIMGATTPHLYQRDIVGFFFALPPLSEQKRIVAKLDELMAFCDSLEESIKNSQEQNEILLQQVLREALEPK